MAYSRLVIIHKDNDHYEGASPHQAAPRQHPWERGQQGTQVTLTTEMMMYESIVQKLLVLC